MIVGNEMVVSDLQYSRQCLLDIIDTLSVEEMTKLTVTLDWSVKDLLAHLVGWENYILSVLPLMVEDRGDDIPPINSEELDRKFIAERREKSPAEVLEEMKQVRAKFIASLSALSEVDLELRRMRLGKVYTIQSYAIDKTIEHDNQNTQRLKDWLKSLNAKFKPQPLLHSLEVERGRLLEIAESVPASRRDEAGAEGVWSVKQVLAHLAGWDKLYLLFSQKFILGGEQPVVQLSPGEGLNQLNSDFVGKRAAYTWEEQYSELIQVREELMAYLSGLTHEEWVKRGDYFWPTGKGRLAELLAFNAYHDHRHADSLAKWLAGE
jgi:hypothetical protein